MALRFPRGIKFAVSTEKKMNVLLGIVSVIFFGVFLKLFYLQILNYPYYRGLSDNNSLRLITARAPRGIITDRNGEILATNEPSYSLYVVPADLKANTNSLVRLSQILDEPLSSLELMVESRKKRRRFEPIRLQTHLDEKMIAEIEENRVRLPGVYVQQEPERFYPHGELASHILGYIGEISEEDLTRLRENGYSVGAVVGKNGIERVYDQVLRGEDGGVQIEVDASGIQRRTLAYKKPIQGQTLQLSIDWKIQELAEKLMGDQIGSVVVTNPQTGEILALVSHPNFDPNEFVSGISFKDWNKLLKDKNHPLEDRAIQGQYPPGSIFKLVTTLGALEDGVIDFNKVFLCKGIFWFKTWPYRCWRTSGHGWVNLERAIIESCDIFFYQLGLLVKIDKIYSVAKEMGLGSKTQVDLDHELSGLVPNPQWKEATQHQPWFPGNTIQMSIGQGYLLTTPLQMLDVTAGLAMNGKIFKPHLLYRIVDQNTGRTVFEKQPEVLHESNVDKKYLDFIKATMEKVINSEFGTGKKARIRGVRVAGKTGTSENPHGDNHAWFTAFAPAEDPKVAIIVMVENGGEGGIVSAPIAKRVMEQTLGLDVTPWQTPTPVVPQGTPVLKTGPVMGVAP
ncbi:MAG TPA: penicillin-binding protein 2 [bacterium]|nr:penicillin-binding protein 2 [bacterium]